MQLVVPHCVHQCVSRYVIGGSNISVIAYENTWHAYINVEIQYVRNHARRCVCVCACACVCACECVCVCVRESVCVVFTGSTYSHVCIYTCFWHILREQAVKAFRTCMADGSYRVSLIVMSQFNAFITVVCLFVCLFVCLVICLLVCLSENLIRWHTTAV